MVRIDTILRYQVYDIHSPWDLHSIDYLPTEKGLVVYIILIDNDKNLLYYTIDNDGGYSYGTITK